MTREQLQAVVVGAGWAGKGHTLALQHSGVLVQAICARDAETVKAVARMLGVPEASVDWRQTLGTIRPDIVSIATPASLRKEIVEVAAGLSCHVLCEKPLAADGSRARELCDLVERAGVKHAFAATHRYDPSVAWLAELIRSGAIGELCEIDVCLRQAQPMPAVMPWGWWFSLEAGGGWLNNQAPHVLGMLERVIGSQVACAMGESRRARAHAPVIEGIHDMRQLMRGEIPPVEDPAALAWRAVDAEAAASMLLAFRAPQQSSEYVMARSVYGSLTRAAVPPRGWYLYGTEGTLVAEGAFSFAVRRHRQPETDPEPMPVPQRLLDALPVLPAQLADESLRPLVLKWAALVRDLVADIQGTAHEPYLDFRDGWRYQEAIDAARSGEGWRELPARSR